ncbi:MAG: SDR family oxidoreductase [Candidatus Accumulibacter sp.]|uniref:SDR family NAD(P)-dependent oxidoreductase n=1 Tax=Accumulibacter sp. TaxID=2053492 RepID=UPI00287AD6D5|nr:SDR family oxidoreductase [Accumulibacter sp.]MDS4015026.1 SDR family oxidoreductase [Accumulibacter sp.]
MKLDGAVAVVTGAAQNIGRCIALTLADAGCRVVALDLNEELLGELANERIRVGKCDVADPEQAASVIATVVEEHGRIDLLVNAAGWICSAPLFNLLDRAGGRHELALWEKSLRLNLTTAFVMGACVAEQMIRRRTRGLIINISSVAARGNAGQSAYAAAKAGSNALALSWAKELGALGIRALAIAPGFIDTSSTHAAMSRQRLDEWLARIPLRRLGTPEQVADAVVFAATNDYLTGTVIELDGGLKI